ncbi:YcxB family protein [Alkalibacterium kapii]|uniref:YcxB-like C-terminal domain-containing protein n=1 Tax=Alkalibacterium kapii TaxID=426704 RepID=A0A511ASR0_9LACT|nr:YcxB family protein [Alkalibacterium kapii]GEK91235.1 hypothetical protein AKA01nite_08570 [Alkalibacterium kapii]
MKLEYELTEEDYLNFNIYHSRKSPSIKKKIFIQRIMGPIIFMITPFVVTNFSDIPLWYWLTIFIFMSIVWFIYYPKYVNWELKKGVEKMLEEGNNENLFDRKSLTITEEGLREVSSIGSSNVSWDKINSVDETKEYIYVYISSLSAHIIPKRAFNDPNEQKNFLNELMKQTVS